MFKDAAIPPPIYANIRTIPELEFPVMISTTDSRTPPPTIPRKPTIKYIPELVMPVTVFYAAILNKSLMSLANVVTEPKPYSIVTKVLL